MAKSYPTPCPVCLKECGGHCETVVDKHLVLIYDTETEKWTLTSQCKDEEDAIVEFDKLDDGTPKIILFTGNYIQF